ncbi:MAG: hypothetical protein AAFO07_32195, partial [Bacteroidota bacterium]
MQLKLLFVLIACSLLSKLTGQDFTHQISSTKEEVYIKLNPPKLLVEGYEGDQIQIWKIESELSGKDKRKIRRYVDRKAINPNMDYLNIQEEEAIVEIKEQYSLGQAYRIKVPNRLKLHIEEQYIGYSYLGKVQLEKFTGDLYIFCRKTDLLLKDLTRNFEVINPAGNTYAIFTGSAIREQTSIESLYGNIEFHLATDLNADIDLGSLSGTVS